uniref:Protein dpy-30 homolog n=1 Tax=Panagrolaimus superbus TaxID=310955 RepID=A0A914Y4B2_9BILA
MSDTDNMPPPPVPTSDPPTTEINQDPSVAAGEKQTEPMDFTSGQQQAASDAAAMPPPPASDAKASSQEPKKDQEDAHRIALQSIPTRQYLDQTVVPILLQALGSVARERPANPIEYLGQYLLREKDRYTEAPQQ